MASRRRCYEKGSRADNDGFVSAEMTARKRSFFTFLFAQYTHDTNGIRARKRKAKRCIWAHNLSFGLLCYSSWGVISDQSKKTELCSVCSENDQLPPRSVICSLKRPFICHALLVFANNSCKSKTHPKCGFKSQKLKDRSSCRELSNGQIIQWATTSRMHFG